MTQSFGPHDPNQQQGYYYSGPQAQYQPPRTGPSGPMVAAVTILVVALLALGGFVLWDKVIKKDDEATSVASAGATTTTLTTTAQGAPPAAPEAPAQDNSSGSGSTGAGGDLGLSKPIRNLPCDGSIITIIANAVRPGQYEQEVSAALAQHPMAQYMRPDQMGCSSLRGRDDNGNVIYAVYVPSGGSDGAADACMVKARNPGSYTRRVDNSTPVGTEVC